MFRRSRSFGLIRVTLSKRGVGWSVGNRLFRWGVRADGRVARSFGVPGTGLRHQTVSRSLAGSVPGPTTGAGSVALSGCLGAAGLFIATILGLVFLLGAANTPDTAAASVSTVIGFGLLGLVVWRLIARARRARRLAEPSTVGPALAPMPDAAPLPPQPDPMAQPIQQKCPNPACPGMLLVTQEHIYEGRTACPTCQAVVELNGTFDPATQWERDRRRMSREREARRGALAPRFGEAIAAAIITREPFAGATMEVIEEMFGAPENVATEMLKKGPRVTWRYGEIGISGRYSTRIRFTNGLCDSWKVGDV